MCVSSKHRLIHGARKEISVTKEREGFQTEIDVFTFVPFHSMFVSGKRRASKS